MKRSIALFAVVLPVAGVSLPGHASAQVVVQWDVIRGVEYTQVAPDTRPMTPDLATSTIAVTTWDLADASAIEVSSEIGPQALVQDGQVWELVTQGAAPVDLDMVFAPGMSYTISITAGSIAPASQDFTQFGNAFPEAPYLTGPSFDYLTGGIDPSLPIPLTWPSPFVSDANSAEVKISRQLGGGALQTVFELSEGASSTGTTLPAGTLVAGETYLFEIRFSIGMLLFPDGSGFNSDGVFGLESLTRIEFTAGAPSGSCAGDADGSGLVDFGDITSVLTNWLQSCGL